MKKRKGGYMRTQDFAELVGTAEQALAYERGAHIGYRVKRVAVPSSSKSVLGNGTQGLAEAAEL